MAYTTAQLVAAYTNANLGKAPDAATALTLDAYATQTQPGGSLSDTQALANTLKLVNNTTAVAVETYQFFTGHAPSAAGLSYLVNSTTNTNDLNDAYYSKFAQENRFINFSINLATGSGEGAAAFAAAYGTGVSYNQVVATAYDKIIGNAAAAAAGVDVAAAVTYLSRAENITYLTNFVKANTGLTAAADIELAVKAALIGEILNAATVSGIGLYAGATKALIVDLSDGTLNTDAAGGVNILTAYPAAGAVGTTYTLIPGADTIVAGNANDTFNALTVKADGSDGTTLSSFDSVDGGGGVDTLNIYTTGTYNATFPTAATVKNIEIVNVFNSGAAAALGDASKYQGLQQLWQIGAATGVTNLANGQTAGFRSIAAGNVSVGTNSTATTAAVALDSFIDSTGVATPSKVTFDGSANSALNTISLTGTVVDGADTGSGVSAIDVDFKAGKNVATVNVGTAVATTLTVTQAAGSTTDISAVDLSASTGAVTYSAATTVKTITGGAGVDTLTIATVTAKDNTATAADETVTATVSTGAGNDKVTVNVTGDGLVNVTTGTGNDTVDIAARGTAKLNIDLGDGSDTFTSSVAINATDVIDAGAGVDTLLLSLVGVANVGAFKNFDIFDVKGMTTALDLDILNTNNTVTEIVASGDLGAGVTLSNVGAGVNFRALATADAQTLTLSQKTAGALTVTLDADEADDADTAIDVAGLKVATTNATTVTAVFDAAYKATIAGETTTGDNVSTITLSNAAATSVNVVSGGALAHNVLALTDATSGTGAGKLATLTVTGDRDLTISSYTVTTATNSLSTIDASASTGGLTASLAILKDGGTIKLGSGVDTITVTAASTQAGVESIQGFEKAAAVSISAVAGDAVAKAAAIADADVLAFAAGTVADANAGVTTGTIANGVLTFTGAGPGTLADALIIANNAAETTGETVIFQYLGDSYVFQQTGAAADIVVKLTGVTGVTNLVEDGTSNEFFIV